MQKMNDRKNIVEVRDIAFSYGKNTVLNGVTFEIPRGDYLGMVGPNGAGKTTLLKIILGLLAPSKGSIKLFGKDIREFKDWSKIGYVPQKVTSFDENFPATAYEVVLMGRYGRKGLFHRIDGEDKKLVQTALEQAGMWEYKDHLIGDLSGGQQQRVFIARALAIEPEVVFLDEPAVGIDQRSREEFYALLQRLNKELDMTLVLVSHDIEMVTREVQHIACINREVVCYGLPEEFLGDTSFSKAFGGGIKIVAHSHHH
jgi:zinc transport system ATP-binding protein